tara:strand:- start:386 stop:1471 length:1086 start_codon:yes stop_codon:yes gene_type:complete
MKKDNNSYALILAGGSGSRFWPASRESLPKQFIDLTGSGKTLIQETFVRINKVIKTKNIFISTNKKYKNQVLAQIPTINSNNLICESLKRNTAPSILYASLKINQLNKKAKLIVLPSDHYIEKISEFYKNVEHAFSVSKSGQLLTFGINPKFPSTNYGYIKVNDTRESFQKVLKFTEKPSEKIAEKFVESKMYFWNSGIFVWSTEAILNAFEKFEKSLTKIFKSNLKKFDFAEEVYFFENIFPKIKSSSIDYCILEKSKNTYVIKSNFEWSDLGTWESLFKTLSKKNSKKNINIGFRDKYLDSSVGNIMFSNEKKLIILDSLEDHIIVNNDEMLVVIPRKKTESIEKLKEILIKRFGNNLK